jgi:hypothetical protein
MHMTTANRVVAALQAQGGMLTAASAKKEGIDKVTLKRAADAGLILHTSWNRYVSLDAAPRLVAMRGAALGQDAALAYAGAAHYWQLDGFPTLTLEWCIPHGGRASAPNVHRRRRFDEIEIVEREGIRVTSVLQTLLDVAALHSIDIVERAAESALRANLVTDDELRRFARKQAASRHGVRTLHAVLALRPVGARPTGSDLETLCLQLYRRGRLYPERQWEVRNTAGVLLGFGDFGFPPKAFISEVDGLVAHGPEARQYDYSRQARTRTRVTPSAGSRVKTSCGVRSMCATPRDAASPWRASCNRCHPSCAARPARRAESDVRRHRGRRGLPNCILGAGGRRR